MIHLKIDNLIYFYENKLILDRISMDAYEGEFISILGPSGCGKSTLLNIVAGLLKSKEGSIYIDGQKMEGITKNFAYMPQEDLLFEWHTIMENICLYSIINGGQKEAREKAREHLNIFGLSGCEDMYPHQLSGGMRQRAAFLRTAMCEARVLLLDEPFAALDVITRGDMQDWLISVRDELPPIIILVTHDIDEAIYLSDKIFVLSSSPSKIKDEIIIKHKERNKEWLFSQKDLRGHIYKILKH